ncbi:transcriptional regulator [Photobacterium jeanii]|uniref:Transcriptional regulator n=1 Tax=Photobacterium jeanii TaxID=858640 RepID=A0A178KMK0_9GAMM|nr:LysR family transcriptional regulator [Photobacterium jeanii]OAN18420.1 transcriptional regulator [Photobacterium jeanii]PST91899.1 LysR family transcriptional regulator [Photobacterium jeanii]
MSSIFGSIDDLYLFCKVVEYGSLQKAAQALQLPQSTVSRRLNNLESKLNIRLLEKHGRELAPTAVGKLAFTSISSGMETLEFGVEHLSEQTNKVTGKIKLSMPHTLYRSFIAPTIDSYLKAYPDVQLNLALNNEHTKPVTDHDLLITFNIADMDDMIARPLFKAKHGFFISPEYLETIGKVSCPKDLANVDWILGEQQSQMPFYRHGEFVEDLAIRPRLIVNDIHAALEAVQLGLGVASLPLRHVPKDTNLIHLLPDYHRNERQSYLVYKARKYQPNAVRLLIQALLKKGEHLDEIE